VTNDIQQEPMNDFDNIRILRELIAALDRRLACNGVQGSTASSAFLAFPATCVLSLTES